MATPLRGGRRYAILFLKNEKVKPRRTKGLGSHLKSPTIL